MLNAPPQDALRPRRSDFTWRLISLEVLSESAESQRLRGPSESSKAGLGAQHSLDP